MEAARAAEMERIAREFDAARRIASEDAAADERARKTKLSERLAERRRGKVNGQDSAAESSDADQAAARPGADRGPGSRSTTAPLTPDSSDVLAGTVDVLVESEMERIRR
ncbi:hypothetical protein P43SY_011056 [Pythium insidiosum]|uniref:Uncharacterized protein n=1 Tax=Pythium insidiosum TaxID=114742 RepID=A0AAD5L590_PYTIN|nr:hypothetical protein P43SY_011056 [Pythium insidiosum]